MSMEQFSDERVQTCETLECLEGEATINDQATDITIESARNAGRELQRLNKQIQEEKRNPDGNQQRLGELRKEIDALNLGDQSQSTDGTPTESSFFKKIE